MGAGGGGGGQIDSCVFRVKVGERALFRSPKREQKISSSRCGGGSMVVIAVGVLGSRVVVNIVPGVRVVVNIVLGWSVVVNIVAHGIEGGGKSRSGGGGGVR